MHFSGKTFTIHKRGLPESRRFSQFQRVVTRLASEFINMPLEKLDDAMRSAVGLVGEYCDVFRSSIWTFDRKNQTFARFMGWASDGIEPAYDFMLPMSEVGLLVERLEHGEVFSYTGGGEEIVRRNAGALHMAFPLPFTLFAYPLIIETSLLGCLTLFSMGHGKSFSKMEDTMLRIFADMIANVLRRKERETELQLHHENDRLILDSINEGVVMFSRDGRIININRHLAERFGRTVDQLIGTPITALFPIKDNQDFMLNRRAKITYTYDTGIPAFFEDEGFGKTFSNRCFPVYKDGKVSAVAFFTSDITPLKKALMETMKRAEYQAQLKVMTDFFTNISHEFKTPLTLVFNAEKLIEDNMRGASFPGREHVDKYLGVMRQNTNRLLRLVGNLLDVTKLDSGFMQVNWQLIDAGDWLKTVIGSVEDYAANRGIALASSAQPNLPALRTDVDKLERILLNLLSNAVKHTRRGGHIDVTLNGDTRAMLLSVRDDGEGIPDDRKDIIFDRFKQVNTSLTRASEGSGIGLALCKLLTELLGGRITFESQYGKGSVFTVELPVLELRDASTTSYLDGMDITRKVEMEFSDIQ